MNLTITVKMTLVLFLLCSGFFHFTFASNRLRIFSLSEERVCWKNACDQSDESLATLYDEEDAEFTEKFSSKLAELRNVWLGLYKKHTRITWSDGAPITFNKSSVNVANGEQICEAIDNNTWIGFNCSERKPFMCYKDNNYTLIKYEKNWCQALQHCRTHFSDLASISNETQNNKVIEEGNNTSFWIGLLHDEWEWTDNSCSTFRKWNSDPSEDDVNCTTHGNQLLKKYGCNNCVNSFCSKGTVRIKVIEHNFTWEQAFDYCKANHTGLLRIEDHEDQEAVAQWLNYTDVSGPFWIGLRQSRVFGFWIWSDRTVSYNNWKDKKPPGLSFSNHCGVINKTGTWSDESCFLQLPFLCEEEIVFMSESKKPLPDCVEC